MPRSNPLRHAREAWGQVHNPFPAAAIGGEDLTNGAAPYDGEVLGEDREQFLEKIIVNAVLRPGREFGYLWSQGRKDDTGYGKTRLMLETRRELNRDFGAGLVKEYDPLSDTAIAAVWASMKTTGITGIYPLLFDAIVD